MRLLLLNWRDIRSPRAGGAELLTHEVAKRLVTRGHEVTWFTSLPAGLPAAEEVDGIQIVRRGSELTTRMFAPSFARRRAFDLVVEQINTVPYFAPLWSKAPTVVHVNQLAREVWWYEAPKALAALGYVIEPLYLRAYRRTPAITISESTAADLRRIGLRRRVDVIPMAVNTEPVDTLVPKRLDGRLVAIGRLAPSKRYDHAITALAELRRTHPEAELTIVGQGPAREQLVNHAVDREVDHVVHLPGSVSEEEKAGLLTDSDVLIGCSAREGWGLTVTEAALRGTPSVVYDVPGFRDSVVDRRTGILTAENPAALAAALRTVLDDPAFYGRLRAAAFARAQPLSWRHTTDAFEQALVSAAR